MEEQIQVPTPELNRANAMTVVQWLVACAAELGKPCSPSKVSMWRITWTTWQAFCNRRSLQQYPLDADKIKSFVVECALLGLARQTTVGYLQTFNFILSILGEPNPLETEGGKASWKRLEALYWPKSGLPALRGGEHKSVLSRKKAPWRGRKRCTTAPIRSRRRATDPENRPKMIGSELEVRSHLEAEANSGADRRVLLVRPADPPLSMRSGAAVDSYKYEIPGDYACECWTYSRRAKQQALAAWTARRAMRQRVPAIFPLIALAVRELSTERYTEIGAALLLGAIGGAGGYRKIAASVGVSRDQLKAAFARDEVLPSWMIQPLAMHLYQVAADGLQM